ncbi:MAG TPA: Hsp20/alpha crystallin family protein [Acidimicrobiales bacterium]|nr:Hsp20/alpha crystallin family protein [Acidimicrobiales bacterium]
MRRDRMGLDWTLPERWRRMFDFDADLGGWLRVEEFKDGDAMVVRAELPDVDPDKDVEVTVSEGMLHIRAQRSAREEHKDKEGYRSEFRYGSFERDILLPKGVEDADVVATYKDGVLEVRVPLPAVPKETTTKVTVRRT